MKIVLAQPLHINIAELAFTWGYRAVQDSHQSCTRLFPANPQAGPLMRFNSDAEQGVLSIESELGTADLAALIALLPPSLSDSLTQALSSANLALPPITPEIKKNAQKARYQRWQEQLLKNLERNDPQAVRYFVALSKDPHFAPDSKPFSIQHDRIRFSFVTVSPLYLAAWYGSLPLALHLLDTGANVEEGVIAEKGNWYAGYTPLMAAAARNHVELARELIKRGAIINTESANGRTALLLSRSIEMCRLLTQQLTPDQLIDALQMARRKYWESGEYELEQHCQAMRALLQEHMSFDPPKLEANQKQDPKKIYASLFGPDPSPDSKLEALRQSMVQVTMLFSSPQTCFHHLKILDQQFRAFYRYEHQCEFPKLKPDSYEFVSTGANRLRYPVPKDGYKKIKKHHALQRFLIAFFQAHDPKIAQSAAKWVGFIPTELANPMLSAGDFITEDRRGTGLFHGKVAHMLQLALIILAIQDGAVNLGGNTLQKLLAFFITEHGYERRDDNLWVILRDTRYETIVSFSDPHCLTARIQDEGRQYGLSALADYLTDTFCQGLMKLHNLYRVRSEFNHLSLKAFFKAMSDMNFRNFASPSWFQLNTQNYVVEPKHYAASDFFKRKLPVTIPATTITPWMLKTLTEFLKAQMDELNYLGSDKKAISLPQPGKK